MKILQLVTKRQYRGAEVFAANLSSELIEFGHEVILAGLYKNGNNVLSVPKARNVDLVNDVPDMFSLPLVSKLVSLIKSSKPDVIQCNGSDTLKYMVIASYFLPPIPIVYRNISTISKWMLGPFKKNLYKNFFKKISHVSSVGNETINDFIETFDYPREKTSVIRRGIPLTEIDEKVAREELRKKLGLQHKDRVVMHIGNFSFEKNHVFLVDIFSRLKQTHPHIKLVCIGDGLLYDSIKTLVDEQNLNDTIFLLGFKKDIPNLLAGSDCFVLASKIEGVPGVILEAAIQKKPTIATNVGGVREVLINGDTGYSIEDFDKEEFAKKIIELLENDDLRLSMGEKAFLLAKEEFSPYSNARKFESLYLDLLRSR